MHMPRKIEILELREYLNLELLELASSRLGPSLAYFKYSSA
jgi:hypothetical protein